MRERLIEKLGESLAKEHDQARKIRRAGLELDDEQLSQVPNPQVKEKAKEPPRRLGSFWTDEY
jgi:hypothetical protein